MAPQPNLDNMVIRHLLRKDIDSIVRIDSLMTGFPRNHYFEHKFNRIFGDEFQLQLALAAEISGRVIGYIMGEADTGEYGISEPVASVDTIGIDPEYKRMGVGRILLEEYCSLAAKAGIELMTTLVSSDWPDVIEFFNANGFKPAKMVAMDRKLYPGGSFGR